MALNKAQLMEVPGGPGVVGAVSGGTGVTLSGTGTLSINSSTNITRIVAGANTVISPTSGYGDVTISFSSGSATAEIPSGTVMPFAQAAAPTGWTQVNTYNNYSVRLVSGTGAGTGGSLDFTSVFTSQTITGTGTLSSVGVAGSAGGTGLTSLQIASHTHTITARGQPNPPPTFQAQPAQPGTIAKNPPSSSSTAGSGLPHSHPWSGTATGGTAAVNSTTINLAVQYLDTILCQKV